MLNKINKLKEKGKSLREIAEILNITKSKVEWTLRTGQGTQDNKTQDTKTDTDTDTVNRTQDTRQPEALKNFTFKQITEFNLKNNSKEHNIGLDILNKCNCFYCEALNEH